MPASGHGREQQADRSSPTVGGTFPTKLCSRRRSPQDWSAGYRRRDRRIAEKRRHAGSALLIHVLLQSAHRAGFFLALIDGSDSFDPQTSGQALRNLLWVRCHQASQAVQAADLLLRDGNFPLVVLDLVLNAGDELRKIPQTHWYRLQRLVEAAPTAFLVLTRRNMIGSAQLKLSLENAWRLSDLEQPVITRLNIQVERVHGPREIMATAG